MTRLIVAALLASGCNCKTRYPDSTTTCDKPTQERVFLACVEKLPNGPERLSASGNDWDEVVSQCRAAAQDIGCTTTHRWVERSVWE